MRFNCVYHQPFILLFQCIWSDLFKSISTVVISSQQYRRWNQRELIAIEIVRLFKFNKTNDNTVLISAIGEQCRWKCAMHCFARAKASETIKSASKANIWCKNTIHVDADREHGEKMLWKKEWINTCKKIGRKSTWGKVALISKKIDSFAIDYPFTLLNWHTEEWNSADERILNFRKENMKRNGTAENRIKKRASYRDEGTMQCEKSDGEIEQEEWRRQLRRQRWQR